MVTSRDVPVKGRQELVLIGINMQEDRLISMFDKCLLTDDEFALGENEWVKFPDSFVPWRLEGSEDLQ
jgi:hypothetical protein